MKLKNIPYFRLWFNCFNYKGIVKRKEFAIDFILLLSTSIIALILLNNVNILVFINNVWLEEIIILILFYLLFLPLAFKRIRDTGYTPWVSLLSVLGLVIIAIIVLCLYKSKDDQNEYKHTKLVKTLKYFLITIVLVMVLSPVLWFVASITYDIVFLDDGKTVYFNSDLNDYEMEKEKIKNAKDLMPKLEELGEYKEVKLAVKEILYSTFLGFYSNSISLYVTYDDNYIEEKEKIISTKEFLQEPIINNDAYEIPLTSFEYKGYNYQIVIDEEYVEYCACKSFMLIGFDDKNKEIAYHYFYDFDIDYIASEGEELNEVMIDFMESKFYYFN